MNKNWFAMMIMLFICSIVCFYVIPDLTFNNIECSCINKSVTHYLGFNSIHGWSERFNVTPDYYGCCEICNKCLNVSNATCNKFYNNRSVFQSGEHTEVRNSISQLVNMIPVFVLCGIAILIILFAHLCGRKDVGCEI